MVRVNVKTAINSALSNQFAARRKYVINRLPSVPIVGNPGEAVNILYLEPRSCNAEIVPPCRMTVIIIIIIIKLL